MTKQTRKLIDTYAALALQKSAIERELAGLRPQVVALGDGVHTGREHTLVVDHTTRASLSVTLAKAMLTPGQIAQATVVADIITVRVEA